MIRLFKHYIPYPVLLLGILDFMLLIAAAEAGWVLRAQQIGMDIEPMYSRIEPLLSFGVSLQLAMLAVGVYGPESLQSIRLSTARLLVAISLGVIFLSVMHFVMPQFALWRSNSLYAMVLAFVALIALRNAIFNLADLVVRMAASEVILALEERRNSIPMSDLLRIKTTGVHVNDMSTFLERETGRIDHTVNQAGRRALIPVRA